ncbi:MAG: Transglutaminase-like superfamily protein [Methanosaeta sp. PtaB.Bin039]|nr:MAG: Transglutaminase-like superfamily protein [Methanosaeta sp. PtaB.Bin039]HOT07117.1 transglutaminase domain-containing protein [Methanotrichaceae archaeon]HQF17061.1 transglutaminase domain-containing protein [Methanotrichaceae archaeon]HQI91682.1 transglutaminase domain-containing protein [Methanotrichaceae archaeon]HQJ29071.1 transglutaminase domain-containing protein [Methanotrichaceae archaeon]
MADMNPHHIPSPAPLALAILLTLSLTISAAAVFSPAVTLYQDGSDQEPFDIQRPITYRISLPFESLENQSYRARLQVWADGSWVGCRTLIGHLDMDSPKLNFSVGLAGSDLRSPSLQAWLAGGNSQEWKSARYVLTLTAESGPSFGREVKGHPRLIKPRPARWNATDYSAIDRHALSAPADLQTIPRLSDYLTRTARNDREKARALFRWVTENVNYDMGGLTSGQPADTSAAAVLKSRRSICGGYTDLFSALAQSAGLEAVSISGYAKGYDYRVGDVFPDEANHAWNAVRLDGAWYLLDTTWGAGYVDAGRYIRQFEDFYFLTPPEQFAYTHYPLDSSWQLLADPISKQEFEDRAYQKPAFFKAGLRLIRPRNGTILADRNVEVLMAAPADVFLTAQLLRGEVDGQPSVSRDGPLYRISATLPGSGEYILRIFARRGDQYGYYDWAADLLIRSE